MLHTGADFHSGWHLRENNTAHLIFQLSQQCLMHRQVMLITMHCGRQLATAEARIVGADGKLYAHATTTCLVFDFPAKSAA